MNAGVLGVYVCLFLALYFEVFLLLTFFEKKPEAKTKRRPKYYPTVSMVVPCFNEEKTIAGTIESLLALEYPKNKLDIMVIDDGSTDNTRAIAESFSTNPRVRFYHKENGGKYTALNFAIQNTTSELIGCLDADSFVAPDALIEMVKRFESNKKIMALTPTMKVHHPRKLLELMQAVEYTFGIFYKKMFDNLSALNVLPGPFSVYRREVFTKIGLFRHAHNTEDMEIAFRMHAHGLLIENAHTAFVYTKVPATVRALIKQRTRWSQGFLQNLKDYKYMVFNPRFGNFGILVLPFGLLAFIASLYTAGYMLYKTITALVTSIADMWATRIPLHLPTEIHIDWFYLNTSMMTFVIFAVLAFTVIAVVLGQRISKTTLSPLSLLSYFTLFGFIAPFWLVRAAWGAVMAKESSWR